MLWGNETIPPFHFGLARTPQAGMMGSMEQEQYYIATEDGKTEGPYALGTLKTLYAHSRIAKDALVCIAGGQEWVQFGTVLEKKQTTQAFKKDECTPIPKDQSMKKPQEESESLEITVEGLFRLVGFLALLAGFILFCINVGSGHTRIGFIYFISVAFSCLGCFWCAKVIKLLSRAVDLLSVIAKRAHNSGNSTDKQ